MMPISIDSLCCGYGKHQILYDVSFEAGQQITVIVGSNGSGKSTLLKAICGLADVYSGEISLYDKRITGLPTYKIMSMVSYMPQTNNVFGDITIRDNLLVASMPDKPDWNHIFEFFPMLQDRLHQKAKDLSGGQRQLLAMAMCISKKPNIILFDEPTASLSPAASNMVLEKIKEIQTALHNCIVLVEQNVKDALAIGDRCYLFAGGKKMFSGKPDVLLADKDFDSKFLGLADDNTS